MSIYESVLNKGRNNYKSNKKLVETLKKRRPKDLDNVAHQAHDEAFDEIDCLKCANCCKTTSPGMHDKDVERLAKHLKTKPSDLIEKYMDLDKDGEYVFRSAPCPFLGSDNYCTVYESRPLACREYPHTNRRRFYQVLDITLKNTEICPAVVKVLDAIHHSYAQK